MEPLKLSSSELLYICSEQGIESFIGIKDGFYGLNEAEINAKINTIKNVLLNKQYADMDFDGEFEINKDVLDVVNVCASPEKYISFNKVNNKSKIIFNFYEKDDKIYMFEDKDEHYDISAVEREEVSKRFFDNLALDGAVKSKTDKVFISMVDLRKIKNINGDLDVSAELKELGYNKELYEVLYDGMKGYVDYYSLYSIDNSSDTSVLNAKTFVKKGDEILKLTLCQQDYIDGVEVSYVSAETIKNEIDNLISDLEL